MTVEQLRKRVEAWQSRLGPLGVSHWKIDDVSIEADEDSNAGVHVSGLYDSCSFYFTPEFLAEASGEDLDRVILHEWTHVSMRDLDKAIESVEYELGPIAARAWSDRMHHEREALVERIARQFVAFCNKPQQ